MNAKKKSRILNAGLALALAALACNMPSGAATETPTFTPEVATETATLPPLATVVVAAEDCIATANQDANMRTGPGTDWPVVSQLAGGNSAKVTGHNGNKSWWQLNDSAWISASLTTTTGDCSNILVVGFPPPPPSKTPKPEQPTKTPTTGPTTGLTFVFPIVTFIVAEDVAFEVDFNTSWNCGSSPRVSFILYNQGNVNIESLYYSVEAPAGTYLNPGTVNNAPFETTPTESQPACAQAVGHGQASLATGVGRYVPVNISSNPGGEGFLYIEACSQNNRSGTCESQILYFNF